MKQLLYISFFFFPILSFGQEVVISGIVISKNNGEPLYYVKVSNEKNRTGVTTDFEGKYTLKASLNDTLIFSFIGMKTQKVKVDKEEINIELEDSEEVIAIEFGPPFYSKKIKPEEMIIVSTKDIENADNPKYNFKKNAENNVFVIYVSEWTTYNLNKEDLEFEQKYNVKYSLSGSDKNDYLKNYNKLTFKHLKKKYKKSWLKEIRKDAVGLKRE